MDRATLAQMSVDVELRPVDDDEYRAELSIRSEHGATRRSIEAAGCDALVDAVSLLVVIHADPLSFDLGEPSPPPDRPADRREPALQRPSRPDRVVASRAVPARAQSDPSTPSPPPTRRPRELTAARERPASARTPRRPLGDGKSGAAARAAGLVGWGRIPDVDLGVSAALILTRPRWRVEASGLYLPPRPTSTTDTGLSARVRLVGGRLLACPTLWSTRDWAVPLCLGVEAGAAHGQGRGGSVNRSDWTGWAAGVVGPRVQWHSPEARLGVWLGADVAGAFVRPQFAFEDAQPVHESSGIAVQAMAGLEVHFRVTDRERPRQEGVE